MRKYTQKELKNLVALGVAEDITDADYDCLENDHPLERLGCSHGVYGMNGGLIRGKSGKLYVIRTRNSLLFRYF